VNQVADRLYQRNIQQKQLQAQAFEAGGPYLMNQLYGGGNPQQQTFTPNPNVQMPQTNDSNQNPPTNDGSMQSGQVPPMGQGQTQGGVGSPTPTNGVSTPQTSAQTMPSQNQVPGLTMNGQPVTDQTIHDTHSKLSPQQRQALANFGITDPSQAVGMGKGGQNFLAGYKTLGDLALQPGQQQAQALDLQNKQFEQSQQPTIAAKNQADLKNAQMAVPQTQAGKAAEEVSKQGQKTSATDTAQLALNQFAKSFMSTDQNGQLVDLTHPSSLPYVTGAKAALSKSTSGRMGGQAGGEMLKQANILGNSLVGILTANGRMNENAARDFVNGIIPAPDEPTPMKVKHLDDVQNFINTIKNGDANTLNTVIATITGSKGSAVRQ
jgi:hypothetical protein